MQYDGQTVIVTGGASGIGAAIARQFAAKGANVVLGDLAAERAKDLAQEIKGLAVECDVSSEADINHLVAAAEAEFGHVDVFVSNAGLGRGQPDHAASASNDIWQLNWDVHVMAHVYAARAVLPGMIERGSGCLIQVSSAAGLLNQIGDAAYSATKHAAVSFAESLAITHAEDGIKIAVVCPQYVATPLLGLGDEDAEGRETLISAHDVAQALFDGLEEGLFLILPHPVVAEYTKLRAQDPDRWLQGMRMLQAKAKAEYGKADPLSIYKLV